MKKELTTIQKKNKYNRIQKITYMGEYVSMAAPYIAIGIANYDKYFVEYDGTKMSIAFIMALAIMGFTIWAVTKKKLENTLWSVILKMAIFAFICSMLGSIINDLATILWFGVVGLLGSEGLDAISKSAAKKKEKVIQAIEKAEQDMMSEDYKKENKEVNIGGIL